MIDKTKRWGINIGYGSNGMAGKMDFPIGDNDHMGGWLYGDKETKAGGVQVRF